jgi:FkbM family methyltransferase
MVLRPYDYVDRHLFFAPQLYDRWEVSLIHKVVRPDDTVLDIGANIGFYSLVFSRLVGPGGKVVAIEAMPDTYQRLMRNVELNKCRNLIPINVGVSDMASEMTIWIRSETNSGANSLVKTDENCLEGPKVPVLPLIDVLQAHRITSVKFAKFDIEGMERRVLKKFFEDAPEELFPVYILGEDSKYNDFPGGNNVSDPYDFRDMLLEHGYREVGRNKVNQIYKRADKVD